jgi:hypothetical protein
MFIKVNLVLEKSICCHNSLVNVVKSKVRFVSGKELGVFLCISIIVSKCLGFNDLFFFLFLAFSSEHDTTVSSGLTTVTLGTDLGFASFFLGLVSQNFLVSASELSLDFSKSCNWSLHPLVSDNISHGKTLAGNELEHACEHFLEFSRETSRLVTRVRSPEDVSTVSRDELIETIILRCLGKWRVTRHHDEKND